MIYCSISSCLSSFLDFTVNSCRYMHGSEFLWSTAMGVILALFWYLHGWIFPTGTCMGGQKLYTVVHGWAWPHIPWYMDGSLFLQNWYMDGWWVVALQNSQRHTPTQTKVEYPPGQSTKSYKGLGPFIISMGGSRPWQVDELKGGHQVFFVLFCLFVCLFVCLSVCLFVCLFVVCLFVCFLFFYFQKRLSVLNNVFSQFRTCPSNTKFS